MPSDCPGALTLCTRHCSGAKLFPAFKGLLNSTKEEAAAKEAALLVELELINTYLAANVSLLHPSAPRCGWLT
jgi:hypothetical protein